MQMNINRTKLQLTSAESKHIYIYMSPLSFKLHTSSIVYIYCPKVCIYNFFSTHNQNFSLFFFFASLIWCHWHMHNWGYGRPPRGWQSNPSPSSWWGKNDRMSLRSLACFLPLVKFEGWELPHIPSFGILQILPKSTCILPSCLRLPIKNRLIR